MSKELKATDFEEIEFLTEEELIVGENKVEAEKTLA